MECSNTERESVEKQWKVQKCQAAALKVCPKKQRKRVVNWMIEEPERCGGEKNYHLKQSENFR